MIKMTAEEWLESWVDENFEIFQHHNDKAAMAGEAAACRPAAQAEGCSSADLNEAAGGDLDAYPLRALNSMTDAEVDRKSGKY